MTDTNQYSKIGYYTENRIKGMEKTMKAMSEFSKDPSVFDNVYSFTQHIVINQNH